MTDSKCRVVSFRRSVFVASYVEVNVLSVGRVLAICRMAQECFAKAVSNLSHMMLTHQLNTKNAMSYLVEVMCPL
jgi:carbamoylphosphate synthase large subunit